jgi:tripartite-type tricarboxylate transporter receptor subunit TctC
MISKLILPLVLMVLSLNTTYAADPVSSYPTKPIRIIVGFSPGGAADTVGRALAEGLSTRLGQPVVVENKAGANGNIAAEFVARAPADGYVLYFPSIGHAVNVSLYKNLSYDAVKDFTAIGGVFSAPNILVVPMNSPYKTVGELIAAGKANPGKLNFGTSGPGTGQFILGSLIKGMGNVDIQLVPYKGAQPVYMDLLGGRVDLFFDNTTTTRTRAQQAGHIAIPEREATPYPETK